MEDREKLKHLLKHWAEHNDEHVAEFRQWAVKARDLNEEAVSDEIVAAANQLEKANEFLDRASKAIGE